LVELDRAKQVAYVSNGQRRLAVGCRAGHDLVDAVGSIDDGKFGVQAQMNKHPAIVGSGSRPARPVRVWPLECFSCRQGARSPPALPKPPLHRKPFAMPRAPRALLPALLASAVLVMGCASTVDDKTANWSTEKIAAE